jgi:hypothetical protein
MALTKKMIHEVTTLLKAEDSAIWAVGDYINEHEISDLDLEELAEEVNRRPGTLRARATLAATFAAKEWDRASAPLGVWQQLARLDDHKEMAEVLAKKPWGVNELRKEVDRILERRAPIQLHPPTVATRVTRYALGKTRLMLTSELDQEGVLSIALPTGLMDGEKVKTSVVDGKTIVTIPLDVEALTADESAAS